MTTIATDVTEVASSSRAGKVSAGRAGEVVADDTTATNDGPRRGSRTRKQTSKAAGLEPTEITVASQDAHQAASRSGRKRKAEDDNDAEQEQAIEADLDEVFDGVKGGDAQEDTEDEKEYCICRGKDDGTFMISCERCQEWFHTKCLGITQKAAKKLDEYVCDACTGKTSNSTKAAPKPTKRYKSLKGRQATKSTEARNDSPSLERNEEEEEISDDNDASDGDEYVGERGGDVSDPEDTVMHDVAQPGSSARSERTKQSNPSSLSARNKGHAVDIPGRRVSETMRRPSASSKAASTSKKGSARKPTGPTDASTEEARSRARKVLATALEKIFVGAVATTSDQTKETDEQLAEAFAALLEEELFEVNADAHGSLRVVGAKYKDRFRTFLFSLKDAKNTTLHSRIASGQLKASELAKMSNEELANDSIRQATEKARLEALQRSTLRAEEAGPLRKITHKGEIEIESDALVARDQPGKFARASDGSKDEKPPAARVTESEPAIPTSASVEEDESEVTGAESPKRDLTRRSAPAAGRAQESPTRVDFGGVWTQSDEVETDNANYEPQQSFGFDVASPHDGVYNESVAEQAGADATGGADDFIDSFLDGPNENNDDQVGGDNQATSKQDAERSTTPATEPSGSAVHRYRNVIWNGLIDLPDVFAFQGHVKQIAGRSLTSASRVWPKFFPERPLLIAGRLPTKAAVDFLLQVVNAARTEILAFTMEPGASKDGTAKAQESDLASFDGMLKHFKNADRWGALHISSSVKGSLIKDFYVVPLYKDEEVPLWLDMAESDCLGADWHTKRDRDLLVLVAVVIRDALQSELSKAERSPSRQRSTTNDDKRQRQDSNTATSVPAPDEGYNPSVSSTIPLGTTAAPSLSAPSSSAAFGLDALQSLLRTLGKSAAPPAATSVPPASTASGVATPPGPAPPGPPPGPPPAFPTRPAPANASPMAGSWSPYPPVGASHDTATPPQHWPQQQPPYSAHPHSYAGGPDTGAYGHGGGWDQGAGWQGGHDVGGAYMPPPPAHATPPQPQEMPEEEYPGQYNPEFLAQANPGAPRGGSGFGGRGRGHGLGYGYVQEQSRGGWGRGGGW